MIILEYSAFDERTIARNLGAAEYSYWFVRKAFRPVLKTFGTVVPVADPEREVNKICESARRDGEDCVFFSFSAPQCTPVGLACPTIPVFAWEYDTIPNETWNNNPLEDWRKVFSRTGLAITHSIYSVDTTQRAMGKDFPIWSIPAPVYDRTAALGDNAKGYHPRVDLDVTAAIVVDIGRTNLALFAPDRINTDGARALMMLRKEASGQTVGTRTIPLKGVIYTAIFNPADGRKNWLDMTAGFIWAFRDTPDAVLILKATHTDILQAVLPILEHVRSLGPFRCRIILLHGLLSDDAYRGLIAATSYAVNTSDGEGQCLPLMEFMAAGRPAVAPRHTAMLEYVTPENSFVIASHGRPAFWPHDDRQAMRCLKQTISFASLVGAFRESYRVARTEPDRYARMSAAANASIAAFCSDDVVTRALNQVFNHIGVSARKPPTMDSPSNNPRRSPADQSEPPPQRPMTPYELGLVDIVMSGWYNNETGELAPGFPISADDVALDVGCGEGGISGFCGRMGAHVILTDMDANKVATAAARLADTPARRVETHVADAMALPLPDGACSRVICTEVLEHVDDPQAALKEMIRVGRPGALYLITVPAGQLEHLLKPLAAPIYFEKPNHIRIFDGDSLAEMIEAAGLKIERRMSLGFYWALWQLFFWQTGVELGKSHPSLDSWADTWRQVLQGRDGAIIKKTLDDLLPRTRAVIARKI
jgi:SAM-dependent methyltransferase